MREQPVRCLLDFQIKLKSNSKRWHYMEVNNISTTLQIYPLPSLQGGGINHKSGQNVRVNTTLVPPGRGPHCLACREPLSRLCFPRSHSMQLEMILVNGIS